MDKLGPAGQAANSLNSDHRHSEPGLLLGTSAFSAADWQGSFYPPGTNPRDFLTYYGTKENRQELDRLMADAHRRRFDRVVVWNFDRFARSVSHLLRARNLQGAGHRVCSFSEQMGTSTPASKMAFTVLGAVAELEPSLIVERVKAGLRNAKAKGKRLGRPNMVVDVRRVARLRTQGFGWKKISREIGIGVGTLYRLARDGSKTRENVFWTLIASNPQRCMLDGAESKPR